MGYFAENCYKHNCSIFQLINYTFLLEWCHATQEYTCPTSKVTSQFHYIVSAHSDLACNWFKRYLL